MNAILCGLPLLWALCQPPSNAGQAVAGQVFDLDQKPLAGVTVRLYASAVDASQPTEYTTSTDTAGGFAFKDVSLDAVCGERISNWILVRDERYGLGWRSRFDAGEADRLRIELVKTGDYAGKIVNTAGEPVAGARVVVRSLNSAPYGEPAGNSLYFFQALREQYWADSAADGTFELRSVPLGGCVSAEIEAPGLARVSATWNLETPITIPLEAAGGISGRLAFEDEPADVTGLKLSCYQTNRQPLRKTATSVVWSSGTEIEVAPDGTFAAEGFLPGQYQLRPRTNPGLRVLAESVGPIEIKAGETTAGIEVPASRGAAVRGRVLLEGTDQGIENATVCIGLIDDSYTINSQTYVTTDGGGNYVGYVKPGNVSVQLYGLPRDFLPSRAAKASAKIQIAKDDDGPIFEVMPAATLNGVVVDAAGQPVAGAEVRCALPIDFAFRSHISHEGVKTDADGGFTVYQLDPKDTVAIRARTTMAATRAAALIVPEELNEPLRLVISKEHALHVRGRAVDSTGQGVAGACAEIIWTISPPSRYHTSGGWTGIFASVNADESGAFESEALWPDIKYEVSIRAAGYDAPGRLAVNATDGVADLGTIEIGSPSRTVAGRVVDGAGRPLPNVRVFNEGDSTAGVTNFSAADGGFQLAGLFGGTAFVFASHADYRFTMQRLEPGQTEVTVTMSRLDEPRPARPAATPPDVERNRRIASEILERIRKIPGIDGDRSIGSLITYMARLDPEEALRWSARLGGKYDEAVHSVVAFKVAPDDPEQTLALLAGETPDRACRLLRILSRGLIAAHPETALRLLEEAVARARALDEPSRADNLADISRLLTDLGRADAAKALAEQAAAAAEGFGIEGSEAYARRNIASAIAPFDCECALKLIEPLKRPNEFSHALGSVAVALARTDLHRAQTLLAQVDPSCLPEQHKVGMAYYAGLGHPEQAVEFIRRIDSLEYRAQACGWAAAAVAKCDHALSCRLIESGIEALEDKSSMISGGAYGLGRSVLAGRLVLHARDVGYPDLDVLLARVAALRPNSYGSFAIQEDLIEQVRTAAIVGLVDPELARQLLAALEPRWQRQTLHWHQQISWPVALSVVDPERAGKLAMAALDGFAAAEGRSLFETGALSVVDMLTKEPKRWADPDSPVFSNLYLWSPGED